MERQDLVTIGNQVLTGQRNFSSNPLKVLLKISPLIVCHLLCLSFNDSVFGTETMQLF